MRIKLLILSLLIFSSPAFSEDLKTLLEQVQKFADTGNYSRALSELSWVKQELEKKHSEKLLTFFPETLKDFKGGSPNLNNALGLINVERAYQKGKEQVTVSLTGGGSEGLAAGLAGIGQMAALFGGVQGMGSESFRIAGRTAQLEVNKEAKTSSLTVFLESGSFLKFDNSNSADGALLKSLAEGIDVAALDGYLRGNAG